MGSEMCIRDRWKWLRDECPAKITSLMALPLNCFEGVQFHAEIVFFNARHLEPHLFCTPNMQLTNTLVHGITQ